MIEKYDFILLIENGGNENLISFNKFSAESQLAIPNPLSLLWNKALLSLALRNVVLLIDFLLINDKNSIKLINIERENFLMISQAMFLNLLLEFNNFIFCGGENKLNLNQIKLGEIYDDSMKKDNFAIKNFLKSSDQTCS